MSRYRPHLLLAIALASLAIFAWPPIHQSLAYHRFADTRTLQNSRASDWLRISAGNVPDRICYATDTESFTFGEIETIS